MAVVSLRLNREEEQMIEFLSEYYEQDRSALMRRSLTELYEDIIDRQVINKFEIREKKGKTKFVSVDEVLYQISTVEVK